MSIMDNLVSLTPALTQRVHVTGYPGVIDPVIIAESGRFQSGERRPSEQRQSRLSRSRCSSQESLASLEQTRERVTHSEPRVIEVSTGLSLVTLKSYWPLIDQCSIVKVTHCVITFINTHISRCYSPRSVR